MPSDRHPEPGLPTPARAVRLGDLTPTKRLRKMTAADPRMRETGLEDAADVLAWRAERSYSSAATSWTVCSTTFQLTEVTLGLRLSRLTAASRATSSRRQYSGEQPSGVRRAHSWPGEAAAGPGMAVPGWHTSVVQIHSTVTWRA